LRPAPLLLGYAGERGWHSQQDFAAPAAGPNLLRTALKCAIAHSARLQPPRSKRGALYMELREQKNGSPGWVRTTNLPVQSRMLHELSYGAVWKTIRQPESLGSRHYQ
jgi:hypothetical protein